MSIAVTHTQEQAQPVTLATYEDADHLAALYEAAFGDRTWPAAEIARLLEEAGFALMVRGHGCLLAQSAGAEADIVTLGVSPRMRRQGTARRLLSALEEEARHLQITRIVLEVAETNLPAIRLYESAGYVSVGRRSCYYAGRVDALVLDKVLGERDDGARERL